MGGLIKWFVDNPIAANILMFAMLIGGFFAADVVKKETFPTFEDNRIRITMAYPGAGPKEVEQQIVVRIEESIADLPGIHQIRSGSREGYGGITLWLNEGVDAREVLSDVKSRVDAINTFPARAERPVIQQVVERQFLLWMALYGDADMRTMKNLAYQIRDEMSVLEGVSEVKITGLKNDEVAIEVPEANLRRYNLTFNEVAAAIRQSSLSVPAGTIKSKDGDIQIQTRAQAFEYEDFANIIVRSERDGRQLLLGDIATINDGFSEDNILFRMNGKPGLNMEVKMSDDPLLFEGTANAKAYIEEFNKILPEGLTLKINFEARELFDSRFNLLEDNAISGLILVFIILMLFLRPILALWVVMGIATTFAGAIWLLPYFDVSINMLSMFAFLMVLGIVVDDAIIIGESIYRHQQHGELGRKSAYAGTMSVLKPVFLAVVSTIIFFLPMVDVPSTVLIYTLSIFFVVFLCLLLSLAESLFILPSHLSHMKSEKPSRFQILRGVENTRHWFSSHMESFAKDQYIPALKKSMQHKGSAFLAFFFIFVVAVILAQAGWIKTTFFPEVQQPYIIVQVGFSDGTPFETTKSTAEYIRKKVDQVSADPDLLAMNGGESFTREINLSVEGTSATIFYGLVPAEDRTIDLKPVAEKLKKLIGPLPEAKSFSLNFSMNGGGADITLNMNIMDNRISVQQQAVDAVISKLSLYPGVFNARSDLDSERTEVEVDLKPYAQTLGITLNEIAQQVRQGFYGEEIQRIPRAKEDVRVMLRYPAEERQTLDTLDHIRVRTRDGREIPLNTVAEVKLVPGSSMIRRSDRRRTITITAEVEDGTDANQIAKSLLKDNLTDWKKAFVGFNLSTDGTLREQARFGDNFVKNYLLALLVALALFAVAFRSLFQPFLILLAVPFGYVGAVLGHLIWGVDFSIFSFFGILACSGVVVNDNLVLLERINTLRARGQNVSDAVINASLDRFRPIVLTSITTFVGLLPILFERSMQSQFLKPMVISLSHGVAFSSVITLFLVPCAYYAGERGKVHLVKLWHRLVGSQTSATTPPANTSTANTSQEP